MKADKVITVALVILLIASFIQLMKTLSIWYPHTIYLKNVENDKASEVKEEIDIALHHSKYLHSDLNKDSLNIWFCEDFNCIDSLESQLIRKDKRILNYLKEDNVIWENHDFSRWEKLSCLFRLESFLVVYINTAMYRPCGLEWPIKAKFFNYLTGCFEVAEFELDRIKNNNLLSFNGGPFLRRDTALWLKTPFQDSLRITYFKDNYSYAMGGDSILKEYVYDISYLKQK